MKEPAEVVAGGLPHSEEGFRLLIEAVLDYAIFTLDRYGHITSWNSGAERLKGYRASEVLGKHFSIFYPREDIDSQKPERELVTARADGRVEDEGWRVRKDGTRFWANVVITAVYDETGTLRGFAKVMRDLTERKRAEEVRLRLAQSEEAVRLRNEFLSIAAHELRTPINALSLFLEGSRLKLEKANDRPDLIAALDRALKQVRRLVELVKRLLDATRLAEGTLKLVLEHADLRALVVAVVDGLRGDAERIGSTLTLDVPPALAGTFDPLRIEQLLMNIVQNAIKYGRGGPIRVSVGEAGDAAVIEVADRGIGIEKTDSERIFGRFERSGTARRFGGLGLGLYISKSIVDAHGGSIEVASTVGVGSTFTIHLPLQKHAEGKP